MLDEHELTARSLRRWRAWASKWLTNGSIEVDDDLTRSILDKRLFLAGPAWYEKLFRGTLSAVLSSLPYLIAWYGFVLYLDWKEDQCEAKRCDTGSPVMIGGSCVCAEVAK